MARAFFSDMPSAPAFIKRWPRLALVLLVLGSYLLIRVGLAWLKQQQAVEAWKIHAMADIARWSADPVWLKREATGGNESLRAPLHCVLRAQSGEWLVYRQLIRPRHLLLAKGSNRVWYISHTQLDVPQFSNYADLASMVRQYQLEAFDPE